ncbi:MAG: hypothetical protein OYH77_02705 [Pseudomonadota bacterium]|nr:hypothetical protein [Pseudomonadota bacterium]
MGFVKNHLWLRSGSSELIIIPEHVVELHKRHDKKEFARYFLNQALLNRPARKLFQSWARKDAMLWRNIYTLIINLKFESSKPSSEVIDAEAEEVSTTEASTNTDKTEENTSTDSGAKS